jgi:hypothetical protein
MDESDFEGTLILEKIAEIKKIEEFFDAIDSDDFRKARSIMKHAGIDQDSIAIVLKKMNDPDGQH